MWKCHTQRPSFRKRKQNRDADQLHSERATSQLQLLSDLCDLTNPVSALGWVGFDDGFVGLAGTTSSLIGIYNQWRKTA